MSEFPNRIEKDSELFLNGYHRFKGVEKRLIYELTSEYLSLAF